MSTRSVKMMGIIAVFGLLVASCASDEMKGSPSSSGMGSGSGGGTASASSGATSASTKNIDRIATGAAEDSLNDCMARIPKDASSGQRMLAEQSCHRDQAARR